MLGRRKHCSQSAPCIGSAGKEEVTADPKTWRDRQTQAWKCSEKPVLSGGTSCPTGVGKHTTNGCVR